MQFTRYTAIFVSLFIFLQAAIPSFGQYGITYDIKKPKEYEKRVLKAEKPQKKFTVTKRFMQNTITHYNYFFNANVKLNEVLENAKASFTEDYSQLTPFYNYSLDVTAADSAQLDSISYKSQTGIVLHDLRNDWADNLYLLWGASYYFRKEFDSARLMFQFINYAFAEKEKDGYYKTIGSARDGNDAFTVSTVEKNSFVRRIFSEPPSRNDAFIWQIRNYLAQDRFAEASSMIEILKADPEFPSRLRNDLEEVQAYFFYKQNQWDSTAAHLSQALSNAGTKQEQARWEYLLGQLYEMTGKYEESETYYAKAINHTIDPILDIYARLSSVRVNKDGGENYIEENIASLLKMARRDKYTDYRDIIYYMAAQMELERDNIDGAIALLLKSTKYISNNPAQRNKSFLQLAELSFTKRLYRQSYNFYDSLQTDHPSIKDPEAIAIRKTILKKIADNIEITERQDSLQRIAAMPEDERKDLVKKLARKLRKQQGLKEEPVSGAAAGSSQQQAPASLFADNNKKGDWYFYNTTTRQKGLTDFKSKWGSRPNSDNWRRSTALATTIRNQLQNSPSQYDRIRADQETSFPPEASKEITYEVLYERLPLTQQQMKQSNDSIQTAMFTLGGAYAYDLEDCQASTATFEELRKRFPEHPKMDEVLFQLYYCYDKLGEVTKAAAVKKLMTIDHGSSQFTAIVNTGKNPKQTVREEATRTYEDIYDLFIEGNFSEAIAQKKKADSVYGPNYWTPQLLYIEAVYHIKQRNDSTAVTVLNNIMSRYGGTPLNAKAATMLDVLKRRSQIEEELRNLVIDRPDEDTTTRYRPIARANDPVTVTPVAPKDSTAIERPVERPVVTVPQPKIDTVVAKPPVQPPATAYAFDAETPHYVVIVLNKVDPIFVNEARNAFARHNRETYYNKIMQSELVDIDTDNRLVLISPFKNAQEATQYIEQTKPRTASEIIPWLTGGKYSFSIITERNLQLLKSDKNIDKYNQFLNQHLPGKF